MHLGKKQDAKIDAQRDSAMAELKADAENLGNLIVDRLLASK